MIESSLAAERVDAELQPGAVQDFHVDDARERGDVRAHVVVTMNRRGPAHLLVWHTGDFAKTVGEQGVGLLLDPARHRRVGRPA